MFSQDVKFHADSAEFSFWASSCKITRGFVNISDTSFLASNTNKASYGKEADAIGKADNVVVSLGDGGSAVLGFDASIKNIEGYDFVVFENSFDGLFLELAFVEVSTDGKRFVRFPCISNTQTESQVGTFSPLASENLQNLAGKFAVMYGTPFDLEELKDSSGIDIQNINYVRLIDVVGSIDPNYATYDSNGNMINDPFPTPFESAGFDIDAVGVFTKPQTSGIFDTHKNKISIYPNPVKKQLHITLFSQEKFDYQICNLLGKILISGKCTSTTATINVENLDEKFLIVQINSKKNIVTQKIVKL